MSDAFEPALEPATGPAGQRAHPEHLAQDARLARRLYMVAEGVYSMVGNGLSNQSFLEGPGGLIAIDTGECVEEMAEALTEVRAHTDAPVAACLYTHFHYVGGTRALLRDGAGDADADADPLPVLGHRGIAANRARYAGATGPRITRGMVQQFAIGLPDSGADGLVNVGLGRFFRNPAHAPFTDGHLPVTDAVGDGDVREIAGLRVEFLEAPSDADDSLTIWFPERGVAVHNLLWPALFNVFAIRGEAYRDPRVLLEGLDALRRLGPEHLVATHGPPLSGRAEIDAALLDYRDSIQFLWDQTVRLANRGASLDEIGATVRLPERFARTHFTRQLYGVVEHHVKQIYTGLFGWFDEDPGRLFPLPPVERAERLVAGFGGIERVRADTDAALDAGDWRWALELSGWLVRVSGAPEDAARQAAALRGIGQRTPSANVRNWCLINARSLEGDLDLDRFRRHRMARGAILERPLADSLGWLRVLLAVERADAATGTLRVELDDGDAAGLTLRPGVAELTDGAGADDTLHLDRGTWSELLTGRATLAETLADGRAWVTGDADRLAALLAAFDLPAFRAGGR